MLTRAPLFFSRLNRTPRLGIRFPGSGNEAWRWIDAAASRSMYPGQQDTVPPEREHGPALVEKRSNGAVDQEVRHATTR